MVIQQMTRIKEYITEKYEGNNENQQSPTKPDKTQQTPAEADEKQQKPTEPDKNQQNPMVIQKMTRIKEYITEKYDGSDKNQQNPTKPDENQENSMVSKQMKRMKEYITEKYEGTNENQQNPTKPDENQLNLAKADENQQKPTETDQNQQNPMVIQQIKRIKEYITEKYEGNNENQQSPTKPDETQQIPAKADEKQQKPTEPDKNQQNPMVIQQITRIKEYITEKYDGGDTNQQYQTKPDENQENSMVSKQMKRMKEYITEKYEGTNENQQNPTKPDENQLNLAKADENQQKPTETDQNQQNPMVIQQIKRIKEYITEKYEGTDRNQLHLVKTDETKNPAKSDEDQQNTIKPDEYQQNLIKSDENNRRVIELKNDESEADESEKEDGIVIQQLDKKQKHIDRTNIIGDAEILIGTGLGVIGGGLLFSPFAPAGVVLTTLGSYLGFKGLSMDVGAAVANYAITMNAISHFDKDMSEAGIDRKNLSEIWQRICTSAQENEMDIDTKTELADKFIDEVKKWLIPEYLKRKKKYMRKEKVNFENKERIKWYQFWRKKAKEEQMKKRLIELIDFIVNYWIERIFEDAYLWTVMNNNDQANKIKNTNSIKTMKVIPDNDYFNGNDANSVQCKYDQLDEYKFSYKEEKTHINVDGCSYQFNHKTNQLNSIKIMQEVSQTEGRENNKMIEYKDSEQLLNDDKSSSCAMKITTDTPNKNYLIPVGTTSLQNITAESLVTSLTFQIAVSALLPIDFIFSSITLGFNVDSAQKGSLNQQERTLVTMMQQIDLACEMANYVVENLNLKT